MKTTPSGTLRIAALVGLGIATVLTFRALAQTPAPTPDPDIDKVVLKIVKKSDESQRLKNSTIAGEAEFIMLLCDTQNHHFDQTKKLHFKHEDGKKKEFDLPGECNAARSDASPTSQLNIKTDKVTVSKAAQSIADGELTVIGSHVTIQVASKSPADIKAVVNLLAEP